MAGLGELSTGAFGSGGTLARFGVRVGNGVRLGLGAHGQHDLGWLHNTTTGERLNRGLRGGLAGTLDIALAPTPSLALTSLYPRSKAGNPGSRRTWALHDVTSIFRTTSLTRSCKAGCAADQALQAEASAVNGSRATRPHSIEGRWGPAGSIDLLYSCVTVLC